MRNAAEVYDEDDLIQEALANFAALLEGFDFAEELELLGIGRLQFLRRRQMAIELRGLFIALWRLALARSFPDNADEMLASFLNQYVAVRPDKIARQTAERAVQYWGMLEPAGDADFQNVARHLTSFVVTDQGDNRALTLKMALHIRKAYCFIFDRLI